MHWNWRHVALEFMRQESWPAGRLKTRAVLSHMMD